MSVVDDFYDNFNDLAGNRLTYRNGLENCNKGDVLYGFSYNISSNCKSLQIGSEIVPLVVVVKTVQATNYSNKYAHRIKKDGSLFLRSTHIYNYCMYHTKAEAERAHKDLSVFFMEEIKKEIEVLSNISNTLSKNV